MTKKLHPIGLALGLEALLSAATVVIYNRQWVGTGNFLGAYNPQVIVVMAGVALVGLLALTACVLTLTSAWARMLQQVEQLRTRLSRLKGLLPGLAILLWLAPIFFLLFSPWNNVLLGSLIPRLWLAGLLSWPMVLLLQAWRPAWNWIWTFCGSLILFGVGFVLVNFHGQLSASPFTLDWSEGSRYYNASLWFSSLIYGQRLALPELHPSRYLLQGLAFLVPGAGIAFHRAWQVFLWVFCNGIAAWALVRRFKPGEGAQPSALKLTVFAGFVFLTFFQGPVYYHLILIPFVVLLGFDSKHLGRSLAVVALASIWAGLSRLNWYPVPGLLAALLYLLEEPRFSQKIFRYLLPPALYAGLGLAVAFLTNSLYVHFSGNPAQVFGSAFKSPLLFYRLLPNATYGVGILLASLVFVPLLIGLLWSLRRVEKQWNWVRLLGIAGILAVFFAGGVVVSLKIGGGSNLHNLDNFIVLLVVVAGYIYFGRFTAEVPGNAALQHVPLWLVVLIATIPVVVAAQVLDVTPRAVPPFSQEYSLQWLQKKIDQYSQGDRPVLFISERQLLSFHQLNVPSFEPKYEKVFLMEMAMSQNTYYLHNYADDVKNHRFGLIITEKMNSKIIENHPFSEENNQWVKNVEVPTLENYQLLDTLDGYSIAVYVPKP